MRGFRREWGRIVVGREEGVGVTRVVGRVGVGTRAGGSLKGLR